MWMNTRLVNYTSKQNIIIKANKGLTGLHLNEYPKVRITSFMFVLEFIKIITFIVKISTGMAQVSLLMSNLKYSS